MSQNLMFILSFLRLEHKPEGQGLGLFYSLLGPYALAYDDVPVQQEKRRIFVEGRNGCFKNH